MLEDVVTPTGPYRLRLMCHSGTWRGALVDGSEAVARQRSDGAVVVRSTTESGLETARFMLALADDTEEFHRRFNRDPLLGSTARTMVGYRPLRLATVAHAALRAVCGQLIEARKAAAIERSVMQQLGVAVATRDDLCSLSPLDLRRHGLATSRASTLVRLVRSLDLERLRHYDTAVVLQRLSRERGIGPWSVGVIAVEGLGRYDHGLVGDLGLVKLLASLRGEWVTAGDTAALLAPYEEWQGLAGQMLMLGWSRGLIPGANPDIGRRARLRTRRAA
ncbi:DNA-3-methyladenine glycosylase family protein [Gaiella sp.]|uniref:DNA-3-methyladenine glycosylase family protein n=1 Tax=Gaiella sp. TaxID=2663207 RepID=UPI003982DFC5